MKNRLLKSFMGAFVMTIIGLVMAARSSAGVIMTNIDVVESGSNEPAAVLYTGRHYECRIWIANDIVIGGMSMAFEFSSPDGASWQWESQPIGWGTGKYVTTVEGSRLDDPSTTFDFAGGLHVNETQLPDRIMIGGGVMFGAGIASGPLEHMVSLHFTVTSTSGTLCIDDVFFPPAGDIIFCSFDGLGTMTETMWDEGGVCLPITSSPGGLNLNSTCDPAFDVCPGGDAQFRVFLRDEFGDPVAGDSTSAWIEFLSCGTIQPCPSSSQSFTTFHPAGPSDPNGMMSFYISGGHCDNFCMARVMTTDGLLASVPVRTFDINGDYTVSIKNDFDFSLCNDYNGDGIINFNDANLFSAHAGHQCDLDPCREFGFNFTLNPESNLRPGQTVALELRISNNSPSVCTLGVVGFFSSAYGTGEAEALIQSLFLDSVLTPGRNVFITIPYTIPPEGQGCVHAHFTPSCCDTAVVLTRCFQSVQHCLPDSNVCYEVHISLTPPILDTSWFIYMPSSQWSLWSIHTPTFPLTVADELVYQICTPNLSNLGDSASVIFHACLNADCSHFESFENRVVLTSRSGDVNGDCQVNIGDAVYIINYVFRGGPPPIVMEAGDPNCDGKVNIGDAVYIVNFVFRSGPPPCYVE